LHRQMCLKEQAGLQWVGTRHWRMHVPAHILQQAMELYLQAAYPPPVGVPAGVLPRVEAVRRLAGNTEVPLLGESPLERDPANTVASYALRLGQPMYPYMKLVLDPTPAAPAEVGVAGEDFILRVDSHDRHLHAAPGSPDAAWLAAVRASNKELGERIEHAWSAAGLPTFKDFLRRRLEARKAQAGTSEKH